MLCCDCGVEAVLRAYYVNYYLTTCSVRAVRVVARAVQIRAIIINIRCHRCSCHRGVIVVCIAAYFACVIVML